jgi:alginate O-acetyltransferase complex protein AlgI
MWFLQTDTLTRILIGCAMLATVSSVSRRVGRAALAPKLFIVFDLFLLLYADKFLALFYVAYTLLTYALVAVMCRAKTHRRALLIVFSVVCVLPFFYIRLAALFPTTMPTPLLLIGFAYNMLKAVDALFYVYYTEERVSCLCYSNFILFFPVITAGPIYRYRDFLKQYNAPLPLDAGTLEHSVKRLILGLFKKLVVLWFLQDVFERLTLSSPMWYRSLLIIAFAYAIVYLDLSGYSDIAIAAGGFVGFSVPENFKNPLSATSFTLFWRKWHVTLGDWIREHIFVVLQGKRLKRTTSACIAFATMLIMSLWHDFSPLGLVSGAFIGTFLVIENLTGLTTFDRRKGKKSLFYLRCFCVTALFAINCLLFLMPLSSVLRVLRGLFAF